MWGEPPQPWDLTDVCPATTRKPAFHHCTLGPVSLLKAYVPAGPHCFCNPCPIFTVTMTQEPHEPDMGTCMSTAFIRPSRALKAAVVAGLAMAALDPASQSCHSPCSWAEASAGKCHQVLPLLKPSGSPLLKGTILLPSCFLWLSSHTGPASTAPGVASLGFPSHAIASAAGLTVSHPFPLRGPPNL